MLQENSYKLTPEEIHNITLHHWPRLQKIATIFYSFDISIIPEEVKDSARQELLQNSFDPLSSQSINWFQKVLHQWETACKNTIKFIYVDKIKAPFFNGIVIANCDNLQGANGYWQPIFTASGQFQFGLVCIPSNYYDNAGQLITYNLRTISHEMGHAIGLDHLHQVESIRVYLQNSPEGMGYSVMPYLEEIRSNVNLCRKMEVCLNTSYAVMPGPLDAQVCQAIYGDFDSPSKQEEMLNYSLQGAFIGALFGTRSVAEYLFVRLGDTQVNARLRTIAIYYSVILLKLVYDSKISDYSSFFEQTQQLMIPLSVELCSLTLNFLIDYLRDKQLHILNNALRLTATSLPILAFSHGVLETAKESFYATWNYGTVILSSIISYSFFSSMGKYLINSFIEPKKENPSDYIEQVPKKSVKISLWSFFDKKNSKIEKDDPTLTHNKSYKM